ncbi:MAG TPA: tetratricopeptide repeat protein [Candidatus Polarisedimenticolaceae bacterium]|nr:tetratricopeptide repeat protein [Candidatus Polarisedimenticolaceae bacterium]
MTLRRWAAPALAALVLIAYAPAFRAGFIWDDDRYVTRNPALLDAHGLAAVWTTLDATPQYYPLTHTTFWIEHALWGLDPRGYHLVNAALHAIAAILVWRILLLLEVPGAWLAAAVFAVHPVHVESVAWVTERKNTLSGVFYLASALVFLRWALAGARDARRPLAASALYLAALLSKTVTATLPIALLLVLWAKRGTIRRNEVAWLAPMLAAGAAFGAITHHLERTQVGAEGADWAIPFAAKAVLAGQIVWFYLGKLLWPANLVFIYPRWTPDPSSAVAWLGTAATVALLAAAWSARHRIGRLPFAALVFFLVSLAPALGFFSVYPMRYSWVADHFQYLASLGPIVLASAGAAAAVGGRPPARAAAGALLIALALATSVRCRVYADEPTLWRDTLARNPDAWIAHNNLGILLAQQGKAVEAETHFERVLALRPDHSGALANLGYLQELLGRDGEAAVTLARAAKLRPDDADARTHLVRVLLRLGRDAEALGPALEAARLRPDDADVNCDAGTLLATAGRPAEAIPLLERALRLRPGFPRAAASLTLARRAAAGGVLEYPAPR